MPRRGEVWLADSDPTLGREQRGVRPCIVLSVDIFNHGPADLVVVVPLTSRRQGIAFHVEVTPPMAGYRPSFIVCENVRSVSKQRLMRSLGVVSVTRLREVEERLQILLGV